MEHTIVHLAETAAWFFAIVFAFAIVGVVATIRWIVGLFVRTEQAVESGIENVERRL
ncbi:MAG TPA: hypothetical protein VMH02_05895 [Verrucomicrobiae bacterium]|nr:hypothetical protein [Verrucomicrobiae bacterium]